MGDRFPAVVACAVALTVSVVAATPSIAQTPSFTLLGIPQGLEGSTGRAISADGTAAAGDSVSRGFVWSRNGGRNDFGLSAPFPSTSYGISGNGQVVVGGGTGGLPPRPAYRWTQAGGYQSIGSAGFTGADAYDASFDGSVIVGIAQNGIDAATTHAFRWTQASGMQILTNQLSRSLAVSGNGAMVVGGTYGSGPDRAFVWSASVGMQFLPNVGGSGDAEASAINFDGSIIAGRSGLGGSVATMWINGVASELSVSIPSAEFVPNGVSDDGAVVTGRFQSQTLGFVPGVWTAATGAILLTDYLEAHGVDVPPGVSIRTVSGLSADGKSFVGTARAPEFPTGQAYVAAIPAPAGALVFAVSSVFALRRRRGRGTEVLTCH